MADVVDFQAVDNTVICAWLHWLVLLVSKRWGMILIGCGEEVVFEENMKENRTEKLVVLMEL